MVVVTMLCSSGVGRQQRLSAAEASGRPAGAGHQPVRGERRALPGLAHREDGEGLQVGVSRKSQTKQDRDAAQPLAAHGDTQKTTIGICRPERSFQIHLHHHDVFLLFFYVEATRTPNSAARPPDEDVQVPLMLSCKHSFGLSTQHG